MAQPNIRLSIDEIISDDFPHVEAYLSVTDNQGFPIKDLSSTNFTFSEDGQSIVDFEIIPNQSSQLPLAFVLVMDTSGSMNWKTGGDRYPIEDAVAAAKNFVNSLNQQDLVSVVAFADYPEVIQGLTSDKNVVLGSLDSLEPEGDTALYDAIVEAVDVLKSRSERRVIVLLTDGIESGISEYTLSDALDEASRWAIPVYPIGFGSVDQEELKHIAELTGGAAQIKPDSTELQEAFSAVLSILRDQYLLQFDSTLLADGAEHELLAVVDYENWHVENSRHFVAYAREVTVSLPDFTDGQVVGGNIMFRPVISAPAAPAQLEISMDGQNLTTVHSPPLEYGWDSTTVSPGEYTFTFGAEDVAGNFGETSIRLSIVPPIVVEILNPSEGQSVSISTTIDVKVTSLSKIAAVEFLIDGKQLEVLSNPPQQTDPHSINWVLRGIDPGLHEISVTASDVNGFSSEQQIRIIVGEVQGFGGGTIAAAVALVVALALLLILLATRSNRRRRSAASAVPSSDQASAVLHEVEGNNPGMKWPLTDVEIKLGRKREENDIHLKGRTASRQHAIIRLHPEGFVIYTRNPDNPVIVNGNIEKQQRLLQFGDEIQLGESVFLFELKG